MKFKSYSIENLKKNYHKVHPIGIQGNISHILQTPLSQMWNSFSTSLTSSFICQWIPFFYILAEMMFTLGFIEVFCIDIQVSGIHLVFVTHSISFVHINQLSRHIEQKLLNKNTKIDDYISYSAIDCVYHSPCVLSEKNTRNLLLKSYLIRNDKLWKSKMAA